MFPKTAGASSHTSFQVRRPVCQVWSGVDSFPSRVLGGTLFCSFHVTNKTGFADSILVSSLTDGSALARQDRGGTTVCLLMKLVGEEIPPSPKSEVAAFLGPNLSIMLVFRQDKKKTQNQKHSLSKQILEAPDFLLAVCPASVAGHHRSFYFNFIYLFIFFKNFILV